MQVTLMTFWKESTRNKAALHGKEKLWQTQEDGFV